MNNQIFFIFYNLAHHFLFLDKLIVFFAQTFPYIVILSAGIFLFFYHDVLSFQKKSFEKIVLAMEKKWQEIVLVFFSGISAWCLACILKILIHSDRPFVVFPNVVSLISEADHSFPSGHSTFFMALAFAIFFYHKKAGYIFMLFAFLIGIARIMAGVHFPIDIFGGFVLGAGIACLVKFFYRKIVI